MPQKTTIFPTYLRLSADVLAGTIFLIVFYEFSKYQCHSSENILTTFELKVSFWRKWMSLLLVIWQRGYYLYQVSIQMHDLQDWQWQKLYIRITKHFLWTTCRHVSPDEPKILTTLGSWGSFQLLDYFSFPMEKWCWHLNYEQETLRNSVEFLRMKPWGCRRS